MESPEMTKETAEVDLFHRPSRLMRIASLANILSWVILVFAVLFFGVQMYSLIKTVISVAGQYGVMELLPAFMSPFLYLLPGLFLALILQSVSESTYIHMDIEENTRK